jgi:hypothetical protein
MCAAKSLEILVLQYPQEKREPLNSTPLLNEILPEARVKIGLSWPNLKAALGHEAHARRWAVLYLGSGLKGPPVGDRRLQFVDKKGVPIPAPGAMDGLIVLDGTWSQAKTLWWRNSWLLKLRRVVLQPSTPSLYGKVRKEPRRECLSTVEAVAEAIEVLGGDPESSARLRQAFVRFLERRNP